MGKAGPREKRFDLNEKNYLKRKGAGGTGEVLLSSPGEFPVLAEK